MGRRLVFEEKPFYVKRVGRDLYEVGNVWEGRFRASRAGLKVLLRLLKRVLEDEDVS